jgi:hypothetical protein
MASDENRERNEEFERRVVAMLRDQCKQLEEDHPDGYEFADFVITVRFYHAPEPDRSMHPWYGGPYPGWIESAFTRGSSTSWPVDIALVTDALRHLQQRLDENLASSDDED